MSFEASFHPVCLDTWRSGNVSDQSCGTALTVHGDAREHFTYTHEPDLALTTLNVNIYYLCTDHDTSDTPCWLLVCLVCLKARVYVFVFTGFKCSFFCLGMWLGETF